jgi:hypothetical protein
MQLDSNQAIFWNWYLPHNNHSSFLSIDIRTCLKLPVVTAVTEWALYLAYFPENPGILVANLPISCTTNLVQPCAALLADYWWRYNWSTHGITGQMLVVEAINRIKQLQFIYTTVPEKPGGGHPSFQRQMSPISSEPIGWMILVTLTSTNWEVADPEPLQNQSERLWTRTNSGSAVYVEVETAGFR